MLNEHEFNNYSINNQHTPKGTDKMKFPKLSNNLSLFSFSKDNYMNPYQSFLLSIKERCKQKNVFAYSSSVPNIFSFSIPNNNTNRQPVPLLNNSSSITSTNSAKSVSCSCSFNEETRETLIDKFKKAKALILNHQKEYIRNIYTAIEENNIVHIRVLMLNEDKKKFYKKQLLSSSFLSEMLIKNRISMLQEVLLDPFFQFDQEFIFNYLTQRIKITNLSITEVQQLKEIISNVIQYVFFDKTLVKVFGWFICSYGFFDKFRQLVSKFNSDYVKELKSFDEFKADCDVLAYLNNKDNYNDSIITCLWHNLQPLAIELLKYNQKFECDKIITTAIITNSKQFLKYIWEEKCANTKLNSKSRRKYKKELSKLTGPGMTNETFTGKHFFESESPFMNLCDLIYEINNIGVEENHNLLSEIISTWNYLDKENDLMECLFELKAYDEIEILLFRYPNQGYWKFTPEDYYQVIRDGVLDLSLQFLKTPECCRILEKSNIQRLILENYFSSGASMYYGSEMLNHIDKFSWDPNLIPCLIEKINKLNKKKEFLYCHSPLLTCLLLSEIITNVCELSSVFKTVCEKTKQSLLNFCKSLHDSISDEKYIRYLFTQKDTKYRSAYQIVSEIEAFSVLESPEIGSIIQKMWEGRLSYDGIISFSSLKRYCDNPNGKGFSPYFNFCKQDYTKPYFHQFALWSESCSLRYSFEIFYKIALIVLFNIFIYNLVSKDVLLEPISHLPNHMRACLIICIILNSGLTLSIPLHFLYVLFIGKRRYHMNVWNVIDLLTFVFLFSLFIDFNAIFQNGDNTEIDIPFIIKGSLLSVINILVWLRITENLLTLQEFGPLLRMLNTLATVAVKYLLIYLMLLICLATVFATLFYNSSPLFESYTSTFTTLFDGFLSNSNCFNFTSHEILGAVMTIIFITVVGLMLITLLIALLSNEYVRLSKQVDASYRSVLINYFIKYKWDKEYGFLISLPQSLNGINLFVLPIYLIFFRSKTKQFNLIVSKIYFALFYFPLIFILQVALSFIYLPFCYFIGLFCECIAQLSAKEIPMLHKIGKISKWLVIGILFLLWNFIKDIIFLLKTIFITIDKEQYYLEKIRIKEYIQPEDIRNFLQFIHKRDNRKARDLHTLFIDFLDFEFNQNAERDKAIRTKTIYLQKLKTPISYHMSFASQKTKQNQEETNGISGKLMKRNLIIIEILENFLIDDGSDNFIVDIDQLKMLLPKTMNINNSYIKRLVHTDISSLKRAINKFKNKTNAFLQQKLLNKIVGSTIRLNKTVDLYGNKDPLGTPEEKRLNNFELEENEDDFYYVLEDLLKKMSNDIKENINALETNMTNSNISVS